MGVIIAFIIWGFALMVSGICSMVGVDATKVAPLVEPCLIGGIIVTVVSFIIQTEETAKVGLLGIIWIIIWFGLFFYIH